MRCPYTKVYILKDTWNGHSWLLTHKGEVWGAFCVFNVWSLFKLFITTLVFQHCCITTLLWHHNGCDGVSNYLSHHCLLNRLFRHRSKKTSKLHATGFCAGNSLVTDGFCMVTGEFPYKGPVTQRMSPSDDVIMMVPDWTHSQWLIAHPYGGAVAHICLTHLYPDKMAAILQAIFSDAFLWMKNFVFWLKFHWSLFLRVRLTITQHWFR